MTLEIHRENNFFHNNLYHGFAINTPTTCFLIWSKSIMLYKKGKPQTNKSEYPKRQVRNSKFQKDK